MSASLVVFLIGLFGVPLFLLWYGHKLRRRSARGQAVFWGAVTGHCIAGALAIVFGLIPPEAWTATDHTRGFAGLWSLLLFPVAGATLGRLFGAKRQARSIENAN